MFGATVSTLRYHCRMRFIHPSDLSLATKGLILLAIPFIFELAIVGTLWTMFNEADERARNIAVSREIIVKLGHLSATLMQSSEAMMMYTFSARQADLDVYKNNRPEVYTILSKLDKIFLQSSREKKMLESLRRSTDSIDEVLRAQKTAGESTMERLHNCNLLRRELQSRSPLFKQAVAEITNLEKVIENKNMAREAASRSTIQILLICAFCLSVLIAGSLSMFFYKNIVSRIRNLEENSRLLGEGKMVAAPVSGKDEIALLHRAMHRASEDLAQAAREKQKVAIMLSHDLRSPLMSIQGNIALVLKGIYGNLNDEGAARLRIAESSLERLVSMISQFLEAEKFKDAPLKLEQTELGRIFDQTMQMLGGTADNTKVICRNSDLKLEVDLSLMVRVLTNLVGNAIKFSPKEGSIIVSGFKTDKGIEILVCDEGPGIPEEAQGAIFEPYVQTPEGKRVPKSSGLGLSICKEIVAQHGGEIGVKNNDGAGTTFSILLPTLE